MTVCAGVPLLAIDIGNSRIKWGLHDGANWTTGGAVEHAESARLASEWSHLPQACRAIGSSVAASGVRAKIDAVLAAWGTAVRWIDSPQAQCGVRNLYRNPAQLGPDRWAALVAARSLHADACLVVNAGTAVTVDALSAQGDFLGGLIVPGLRLIREALARDTSRLGSADGAYTPFPCSTADAIASGAIHAVAGAIERMQHLLREACRTQPKLIASGGAIELLRPHLPADAMVVDNLVLRGLLIIAGDA